MKNISFSVLESNHLTAYVEDENGLRSRVFISFNFEEDPDFHDVFKFHGKVCMSDVAKFIEDFDPMYEDLVGDPLNYLNLDSQWDPCDSVIPSDRLLRVFVMYVEYLLKESTRLISDFKIEEFHGELNGKFEYTYNSSKSPMIKFTSEIHI